MLFTNIQEIQEYLTVGNSTDFGGLKPHIVNAETAFMRPLLGSDMFDELQEFYDEKPTGELTDVQQAMEELLGKVQKSLIHLAYWIGFQVLNSTISGMGFKRTESANTKSLFKYQEGELKEYFKTAGFNAMDEILEYIESHIEHFNEFKLSPNYTVLKKAFIPNTRTFNEIIYINNSRLTFLRLKSYASLVEDMDIMPVLGSAIFEEIKAEMVKDSPAAKVTAILPFIRKAVAFISASKLMEESGADLTDKGLYFENTTSIFPNDTNKQPSKMEQVNALAKKYYMHGDAYLNQLKRFLVINASDWPQYSGQTGSALRRDNRDKKTFWA